MFNPSLRTPRQWLPLSGGGQLRVRSQWVSKIYVSPTGTNYLLPLAYVLLFALWALSNVVRMASCSVVDLEALPQYSCELKLKLDICSWWLHCNGLARSLIHRHIRPPKHEYRCSSP